MFTIYLACLLFGGVLLLFSMFGGDAEAGDMADADVDFDADLDAEIHGQGLHAAAQFLSFRNMVFFVAFFGLTGTVLSWLAIPPLLTFGVALAMGLFTATLSHRFLKYLKQSESGAGQEVRELEGMAAKVIVGPSKGRRGKIMIATGDRQLQLLAEVADEANRDGFSSGEQVFVLRVDDGVAYVVEKDFV